MGKLSENSLLRQFPGQWLLYWLLLPNLVIILMWPIGGPPMRAALIVYAPLALIVSQLPWRIARMIGIGLLTLWMASVYVCQVFSIPTLNVGLFLQFLSDVRPMNSPEYIVAGLIVLAIAGLAVMRAPAVPRFSRPGQYLLAMLAVFAFINVDGAVTARTSAGYRMVPGDEVPIDSAVGQVKLLPDRTKPHHVVVIVVEALGLPAAAEEKRLFAKAWDRRAWHSRYAVSHGSNLYFGATTAGELRELCGRWAHHETFDFAHADCLPAKFRAAGYQTMSLHGFSGELFRRTDWYPKLGFTRMEFSDALFAQGLDECEGVFPGACDRQVPAIIGRRLAAAKTPQFVYWLTLNSHLPVKGHGDRCTVGEARWQDDHPAVCRLFQSHKDVADAIDRMVMDPALPPTDVLIVGDHKPPFFDRVSRGRFDQSRVPWIYLKAR